MSLSQFREKTRIRTLRVFSRLKQTVRANKLSCALLFLSTAFAVGFALTQAPLLGVLFSVLAILTVSSFR